MKWRLVVRRRAAVDSQEAFLWYEEQSPGLGDRFKSELLQVFDRIVENPAQFRVLERGVRRALLNRFRYAVYFELREDRVIILTILHQRRRPDLWRMRTQ